MTKIDVNKTSFAGKQKIKVLGGLKESNALAPARVGYSKFRGSATSPVKLCGAVCNFLDKALIDKTICAREVIDGIYVEFISDKKKYFALCDGVGIQYMEEAPKKGFDSLIPFIVFNLGNERRDEQEEFCDAFLKVLSDVKSGGVASIESVALCCDSFYYGASKLWPSELEIEEHGFKASQLEFINKQGKLKPLAAFTNVTMPPITAFKEEVEEEKKTETVVENEFQKCLDGDYILPVNWEDKNAIPTKDFLETFVPSSQFYATLRKIHSRLNKVITRMDAGLTGNNAIGKDYVNFFITGKPGTGKTTMAYALGASLGVPVYSIPITKNTEEDTFQGVTKVVNGKLEFVSTDFLNAYTNGGIIVLEEINLADPAVIMGSLGQAVEFPFILQKNGFETVHRHPLCVIIGTMNIGTYGSKGVNQALSSRFKQTYTLNDPQKEDFINILQQSGGASKGLAEWIYGAYDALISALKGREYNAEDICLNITLRGCLGAIECIEEGASPKDAIRDTLIGKIGEADLEIAQRIYDDVIVNLRNFRG